MATERLLKAAEKEMNVLKCLTECVHPDNDRPIDDILDAYGEAKSTIRHRLNGRSGRCSAHVKAQKLTPEEEDALERAIVRHIERGFPPNLEMLRHWAYELEKSRKGDDATEVGVHWTERYLGRHPELATVFSQRLEMDRVNATNQDRMIRYFELFHTLISEYGFSPEDIYNMDEKGFCMGQAHASKIIVRRNRRQIEKLLAEPGNRDWSTVIDCVGSDGYAVPPLIIFKGKQLNWKWLEGDGGAPENCVICVSNNGWTNRTIAMHWLEQVFDKYTAKKTKGRSRLLIIDGHESHLTMQFISYCEDHNIVLLCLPAHTTHLLQPLDVGLFSPVATYYSNFVDRMGRKGYHIIDKTLFLQGLEEARRLAYQPHIIRSAFRTTGLFPYNPDIVLSHLPTKSPERPKTPDRLLLPRMPTTPKNVDHINDDLAEIVGRVDITPKIITRITNLGKVAKGNVADHILTKNQVNGLLEAARHRKKRQRRITTTEAQFLTKDLAIAEDLKARRKIAKKGQKKRHAQARKAHLEWLHSQGLELDKKGGLPPARYLIFDACAKPQGDISTDEGTSDEEEVMSEDSDV